MQESPVNEGWEAFEDGFPKAINPYAHGTNEREEWLAGYNAANMSYNMD